MVRYNQEVNTLSFKEETTNYSELIGSGLKDSVILIIGAVLSSFDLSSFDVFNRYLEFHDAKLLYIFALIFLGLIWLIIVLKPKSKITYLLIFASLGILIYYIRELWLSVNGTLINIHDNPTRFQECFVVYTFVVVALSTVSNILFKYIKGGFEPRFPFGLIQYFKKKVQ
jgi:hypothetical protein